MRAGSELDSPRAMTRLVEFWRGTAITGCPGAVPQCLRARPDDRTAFSRMCLHVAVWDPAVEAPRRPVQSSRNT